MDGFSRTQSLTLTEQAAADLIANAADDWDIVTELGPVTVVNAAQLTAAVDTALYRELRFILNLGDMAAETVDFRIDEAVTAAGVYQQLKALTQIPASAAANDFTQHILGVTRDELTDTYRYLKGRVITGGAVGGMASILVLGRTGPTPFSGCYARGYTLDVQPSKAHTWATYSASLAALDTGGTALTGLSAVMDLPGERKGIHQQIERIAGAAPTVEAIYGLLIYRPGPPEVLVAIDRFAVAKQIGAEGHYMSHDLVLATPITLPTGLV